LPHCERRSNGFDAAFAKVLVPLVRRSYAKGMIAFCTTGTVKTRAAYSLLFVCRGMPMIELAIAVHEPSYFINVCAEIDEEFQTSRLL